MLCETHKKFLLLLMFHFLNFFNSFLGILFKNVSIMLRNHT
ncbi:putative membrane protein [Helicobacter pylori SouthAfrica50]|uniref:Putative membrane protein n=1 Tax=Helicobacter pylori SouthAfrica50 TaxID=1352357 RepID=T2SAW2_HELPX|nr:putative membrane protein [Helicobacter pylori SouthAfrica50]